MSRRVVFLDRDGTLLHERHFLSRPEDVELIAGVSEALESLRGAGFALVVLSNQSGVARGLFELEAVAEVNAEMERLLAVRGIALDGIYICPHHPEGSVAEYACRCDCRKPSPGLALRAVRELDLKLEGSWIVGDKTDDVLMADHLPLKAILVLTGYGQRSKAELSTRENLRVEEDLPAAARRILAEETGP